MVIVLLMSIFSKVEYLLSHWHSALLHVVVQNLETPHMLPLPQFRVAYKVLMSLLFPTYMYHCLIELTLYFMQRFCGHLLWRLTIILLNLRELTMVAH
jgi:hypothetical protein